jgi:hypothetical protein
MIVSSRNDRSRNHLARIFGSASVTYTSTDGFVTVHLSSDGGLDVEGFRAKKD